MKPRASWKMAAVILLAAIAGLVMLNIGDGQAQNATPPLAASEQTAEESTTVVSEGLKDSVFPALMKMVGALFAVVACIYVGLFLLKKMMGKKYSGNRPGQNLEVLETTYLAPKKSVSLVRVADKAVLIGMTESNMSMLTELDPDQTAEIVEASEETQQSEGFDQLFGRAVGKLTDRIGLKRKKPALEV